MMDSNSEHYGGALVLRRPQKGRMAALRDEPSKVGSRLIGCRLVFFLNNFNRHVYAGFMSVTLIVLLV